MLPLGTELQRRGHQVTLIGTLDAESATLTAGLEFKAIGEADFPLGSEKQALTQLGKLSGQAALQYTISALRDRALVRLRDGAEVMKSIGIEALLVDQVSPEGGTIADFLDIPFVSICSAVVMNRDTSIPPNVTNWDYNPSLLGQLRNRLGYKTLNRVVQPITKVINDYRHQWKLPIQKSQNERYSQLAQISQQPAELEFPRQQLPPYFHFTGPFHSPVGRTIPNFPYEKLTGQPLIYASMGTIQNRLLEVFQMIAEACMDLYLTRS
jgi:UDP:flavonoid glycosyltransferase YjiC (YdhE family)